MNFCRYTNAVILIVIAFALFLFPAGSAIRDISSNELHSPVIPAPAWRLFKQLTPRFESWASARLRSSRAADLSTEDISGTEWPLFGAVFYLWSVESLQQQWETNHALAPAAPKEFARNAIDAAARLVIDPTQANWVKIHWGTNYLTTQNAFYRMLYIAALTSHANLTGDRQFLPQLRTQVESLAAEIDASPHGWLDDYPGQCFPGDILTAIHMIRRADPVLGTDHAAFVQRAIRGFRGTRTGPLGLVPYAASLRFGTPLDTSRGCGNSYVSLSAPFLWPDAAEQWYARYVQHFWQEKWSAVGFREFTKDAPGGEWHTDVDSGPVMAGYGFAACAFGAGAARVNGHFEHAFPLTAEMLAASCPLFDGTLLVPRLLSNTADAPYLGESSILYILTRMPAPGVTVTTGGSVPLFVVIVLGLQLLLGLLILWSCRRGLRKWRDNQNHRIILLPRAQTCVWLALVGSGLVLMVFQKTAFGFVLILAGQFFPRAHRMPESEPQEPDEESPTSS